MGLRHHAPTSAIQGTRVFEDATSSCSRCCSVSRSPNEGFAIFENDDKLHVAGSLPLLQSGSRLTLNTQGSAERPPWAKFLHRLRRYKYKGTCLNIGHSDLTG
jgi:hypothetical protein